MNKNPTNMLTQTQIMDALNRRHSPEKQRLLSEGHVAIAGLGGLGSNVACALARIGVGHLHLIDFDVVDITNLNRQQYFIGQLGMYKTDALKSLLEQINPYLDIRTDCIRVTRENLRELFADAPIVCEAFDDPVAKAMLVNGILEYFPEKKLVSATGMTCMFIPALRGLINLGASRISQSDSPRHLVKRLAGGIVPRPSDYLKLPVILHDHQVGMSPRYNQAHKRRL